MHVERADCVGADALCVIGPFGDLQSHGALDGAAVVGYRLTNVLELRLHALAVEAAVESTDERVCERVGPLLAHPMDDEQRYLPTFRHIAPLPSALPSSTSPAAVLLPRISSWSALSELSSQHSNLPLVSKLQR